MAQHPALQLNMQLAGGHIVAPPAPTTRLSARLVEQAGFEAVYMTGFGATASRLGQPDIGLLSQTEMTSHARDMVRAVGVALANGAAALAVQGRGVIAGMPGREKVAAFLAEA